MVNIRLLLIDPLDLFRGNVFAFGPEPIQRRLSLGFPDPLPGFPFRAFACNASVTGSTQRALCDRMVLFQAEYRGRLSFRTDRSDRFSRRHARAADPVADIDWLWFDGPSFVFFADAGTAWLQGSDPDELNVDVGAGLEFGSVAVYGARALTNGDGVQFTLRIRRRF